MAAADELHDAIRIPLYLTGRPTGPAADAVEKLVSRAIPRLQTPAWINVSTNNVSPWFMTGGLLAVRDLTMGETPEDPQITVRDDYYSASLKLLVWLAKGAIGNFSAFAGRYGFAEGDIDSGTAQNRMISITA